MATGRSGPVPIEGTTSIGVAIAELLPDGLLRDLTSKQKPKVLNTNITAQRAWMKFAIAQAVLLPYRLGMPAEEARFTVTSIFVRRDYSDPYRRKLNSLREECGNRRVYQSLPGPRKDLAGYLSLIRNVGAANPANVSQH